MSELDSILDSALDEFDAPTTVPVTSPPPSVAEPSSATATTPTPAASTALSSSPTPTTDASATSAAPPTGNDATSIAAFEAFLQGMMTGQLPGAGGGTGEVSGSGGGAQAEELAAMQKEMHAMLQQMTQAAKDQTSTTSQTANANVSPPSSNAATSPSSAITPATVASASSASTAGSTTAASSTDADTDPVSAAVRMISEGARSLPANASTGGSGEPDDAMMEALLQRLMQEMKMEGEGTAAEGAMAAGAAAAAAGANGGDDAAMNAMIEQMMGSMLSKEYLYQPMKDIAEKYPAYIASHGSKLSSVDLSNVHRQHSCFLRIVSLYEQDPPPSNLTSQLMEVMNEMSSYGTPPKEVVGEFNPPGFDMNQQLPGGMAGLAGLAGIPGLGGAGGAPPSSTPPNGFGGDMSAFNEDLMRQLSSDEACKQQ